ncbi:Hypothetical predicted protein, partial [Mytilus galloprovincialis]
KGKEHYTKKRRENGGTAAHTKEECLKVPEESTLSHQILAVLSSSIERDEMGEYNAVTDASCDLDNTEMISPKLQALDLLEDPPEMDEEADFIPCDRCESWSMM